MTTTTRKPITKAQAAILADIRQHTLTVSPTYREMATRLGYKSPNAVMVHVLALERKGYLTRRSRGTARNIEVLP